MCIRCLNQRTLEVVKGVVSLLTGPGGNLQGYSCLGPGDRPPLTTFGVWVKAQILNRDQFIKLLRDANDWINPKSIVVKASIPIEGQGTTFLIVVDPNLRAQLERRNFILKYNSG